MLRKLVRDLIDTQLADEQFGFRKGRGCADAVHILITVVEKSEKWGENLWMAALDVEKAFDQAHHSSLFETLLTGGIDLSTIAALRRLYEDLKASVVVVPGVERAAASKYDVASDRGARCHHCFSAWFYFGGVGLP